MSNAELQQALEDYRAAENFLNEASAEQMDRQYADTTPQRRG